MMRVNSPRMRLEAKRWLRDHGIRSHIEGDVLWISDDQGQRARVNDGEWLVFRDGVFSVEQR